MQSSKNMFGTDFSTFPTSMGIINAWRALILPRLQYYLENQYTDEKICEEFEWDSVTTLYHHDIKSRRTLSDPYEIVSYFVNALFPGLENSDHARFFFRANLLSRIDWDLKWDDFYGYRT